MLNIHHSFFIIPLLLLTAAYAAAKTAALHPYTVEHIPYAKYLPKDRLTVVITFDGGKSEYRWNDILAFAKKNGIKCTFFVSGVYFIPDSQSSTYIDPRNPSKQGNSIIGFGGTQAEVNRRIAIIKQAVQEGHDVECHLNGHFDGANWTQAMWQREFDEFSTITAGCFPKKAEHVRFPSLVFNPSVYPVLVKDGIKSITSVYGKTDADFIKVNVPSGGQDTPVYEFPIPVQTENGTRLVMMDYNFFQYDTQHHIDTAAAQNDMKSLYLSEADSCFKEHRPFFISHHFSNFNHAAYWTALKSVILAINAKYSVQYMTVSELYSAVSK